MTGNKRQNTLMETKVSISFGLSNTFIFKSNDLPAIGRHDVFAILNLTLVLFQFIPKLEALMACFARF